MEYHGQHQRRKERKETPRDRWQRRPSEERLSPLLPPLTQGERMQDDPHGNVTAVRHPYTPDAPRYASRSISPFSRQLPPAAATVAAVASGRPTPDVSLPGSSPFPDGYAADGTPRLDTRAYRKRRLQSHPKPRPVILPPMPPYVFMPPGQQQQQIPWQLHDTARDGERRHSAGRHGGNIVGGRHGGGLAAEAGPGYPYYQPHAQYQYYPGMPPPPLAATASVPAAAAYQPWAAPGPMANPGFWPAPPPYYPGAPMMLLPHPGVYPADWSSTVADVRGGNSRPSAHLSGNVSPSWNRLLIALQSKSLAHAVVDDVLERCLADDIVPGILMDVFIELDADKRTKVFTAGHAASIVVDTVLDGIIETLVPGVVQETMTELVHSYLLRSRQTCAEEVTDYILGIILQPAVTMVVKETVSEQAQLYMYRARSERVAMEIVEMCVAEACAEEARKAVCDCYTDSLLWSVYGDIVSHTVLDISATVMEEEVHRLGHQQLQEVSSFASSWLLDKLILERLLQHIAAGGNLLVQQSARERFLEGVILESLLSRYCSFEDAMAIERCPPLSLLHTDLFNKTAVDLLLDEFTQHAEQDIKDYALWQLEGSARDKAPS
eukprot:scpid39739/ scgid8304/ 